MKYRMPPLPRKQAVALDLLERTSVFVHLDPRRPGVLVPQGFLKQPQLVLQIGLNMAIAIPDLDVGDEGISCTLSFNKRPHFCRLPWSSIYALIGEQGGGMVWPEDVPPEVVSQQRAAAKKETKPRKPGLRAISGEAADRNGDELAVPSTRRSETPRPGEIRRDLRGSPTQRPPRLVQVVSNPASAAPVAVSQSAAPEALRPGAAPSAVSPSEGSRSDLPRSESPRSESPRPESQRAESQRPESQHPDEVPASARDEALPAAPKRSRPPYLRLVD
jgi:stringent starvation protein B